jgi:hypothetical protein
MKLTSTAWTLFFACSLGGLGPARAEIPKTNERPYAAPSGQALLVFNRPRRRQASEADFRVIDQAGRCLGLIENGWQVAAPIWPGTQMLLIVTGTTPPTVQLLHTKLTAGRTYLVELRARVNAKSPIQIEVIRRKDQPLEAFPTSVKERSPFQADLRKCTEWVLWKRAKLEPKAEIAKNKWDEADDAHREAHTIGRSDGWTEAEIYGP